MGYMQRHSAQMSPEARVAAKRHRELKNVALFMRTPQHVERFLSFCENDEERKSAIAELLPLLEPNLKRDIIWQGIATHE